MFRRSRPQPAPTPGPDSRSSAGTPLRETPDAAQVLGDLLARPDPESLLQGALAHAVALLDGQAQGYAVLRRSQDRVAAVFGYPETLVGLALQGPWAGARPRLLTDGSRELYSLNPPEVREQLDRAGLRSVSLTLVVPLADRGRTLGALVLDRTAPANPTPEQQEAVTRWGGMVAPLLALMDSRDEWRQTARQVASALVEAVESREFDALGHAQAVAETAVRLGRAVGLVERELEELWYAATLHDLGKIHGEAGHAQVGANFLHDIPHLAQAQKAIRHHHERWDGQGEPAGLAGEDIPLYARILAVADTAVRLGDLERVRAQAGQSLDPRLVELLERLPLDRAQG
ncbi:HD domain-containing phosphohydrolase [Deinococcus sp. YIM 77859]|uniref:HD domain-containing phosphohydrolase n=1 Tax=Deinococcus sp. YIM 77859 TaxID=1540221 RepID=UPI000554D496|nr:HD domain-containing phosphohydrolase [Deinococcus sp. YIM 77859]